MKDSDPTREMVNISRGSTLGRYEILERIGAGGMGEVFLARDSSLKRNVAIKFPPLHLAEGAVYTERLMREAQAAGSLDHSAIVHVYEVGEYEGRPYLVMEHVTGDPLDTTLQDGPLSPQATVRMGRRLAEGLDYAHRHGVLHRDIKPGNVIIDIHGRPKLIDFGLAFSPDEEPGADGTTLGTVGFMAPEVIKGEAATPRSDLFSLGVLLYKCLTGHLPFTGDTQASAVDAVLKKSVKWPSDTSPLIPGELQTLITRLLEKNPNDRPQTGAEVAAVLRTLAGDTTAPHPRAVGGGLLKPVLWTVAAAAVVAMGVFGWMRTAGVSGEVVGQAQAAPPKVIVLPFDNLSGGEREDPMGEVMSSLIITGLSQTQSLSVVPNDYAHQLMKRLNEAGRGDDVAQEVDARWLVRGKILQQEPHLIVSSELIDPDAGTVINARRIEGAEDETVFQIADRLTLALLSDLAINPGGQPSVADATTDSPEAYEAYTRGSLLAGDFQTVDAAEAFEEALDYDPDFSLAWISLAGCHQALGNQAAKDSCVTQAERTMTDLPHREQLQVRSTAAQLNGDAVTMLSTLEELVQLDPGNPFYRFQQGVAHQTLGRVQEGIEAWEQAIRVDPNFGPAYNQLAYYYEQVGNFDKSLWAINEYIRLTPGKANPFDSRGDLYARAGRLDEALESYERAMDIDPHFYISQLNVGKVHAFKNNPARAERVFNTVIQATEETIPGMASMGRFHRILLPSHSGNLKTTIERIEAATLKKDPVSKKGNLLTLKALVQDYLGQYDQAVETLNSALESEYHHDEERELTQGLLVRALAAQGKREEAEAVMSEIPEDAFPRNWALSALGRHQEALEVLELKDRKVWDYYSYFFCGEAQMAMENWEDAAESYAFLADRYTANRYMFPLSNLVHYRLGVAYQELGRREEAMEQLERFLDLWGAGDPGLADVADARVRLTALNATP